MRDTPKLPEPMRLGVFLDRPSFGVSVSSMRLHFGYLPMRGGSVWVREDQLAAFWRLLGAI